ncbi:MAG: DUF4093 domain-containing protein [Ruminococcaceae bacterium]|nr:DUF4093 domain-containing protein [Oscillospiraceae bacterium]
MNEKIRINLPIIVEGRYDKSTISSIFDATVITTDGFSVFNSKEKRMLIKKIGERGIILLTDSDAGGRQIRSFISGILPKEKIYHLYIPEIEGKESRKKTRSKSGLLGVEGMKREVLEKVFEKFIDRGSCNQNESDKEQKMLTKLDFFNDGLSGGAGSAEKRKKISLALGFPRDMSANALIEAINLTVGYDEYKRIIAELFDGDC